MTTCKTYELRVKSKEQLEGLLFQYKTELAELRRQQTQRPSLPTIRTVRKNIARVLTVMNEHNRAAIKQFYKGKKYLPKDQRSKQTKSMRNQLTRFEAARTTEKERKRIQTFPERNYTIKA
ncbi:large ribosomal subunit protein uL29B [Monosporozyma unispora]|nr:60S ribosomal protein L35 [Kazachstania unispora]